MSKKYTKEDAKAYSQDIARYRQQTLLTSLHQLKDDLMHFSYLPPAYKDDYMSQFYIKFNVDQQIRNIAERSYAIAPEEDHKTILAALEDISFKLKALNFNAKNAQRKILFERLLELDAQLAEGEEPSPLQLELEERVKVLEEQVEIARREALEPKTYSQPVAEPAAAAAADLAVAAEDVETKPKRRKFDIPAEYNPEYIVNLRLYCGDVMEDLHYLKRDVEVHDVKLPPKDVAEIEAMLEELEQYEHTISLAMQNLEKGKLAASTLEKLLERRTALTREGKPLTTDPEKVLRLEELLRYDLNTLHLVIVTKQTAVLRELIQKESKPEEEPSPQKQILGSRVAELELQQAKLQYTIARANAREQREHLLLEAELATERQKRPADNTRGAAKRRKSEPAPDTAPAAMADNSRLLKPSGFKAID